MGATGAQGSVCANRWLCGRYKPDGSDVAGYAVPVGAGRRLGLRLFVDGKETAMAGSVYKVIELVGTSPQSWEEAAKAAVESAAKHLRDLRIAEVVQLDMHLEDGKVQLYRAKVKVSFKYHGDE